MGNQVWGKKRRRMEEMIICGARLKNKIYYTSMIINEEVKFIYYLKSCRIRKDFLSVVRIYGSIDNKAGMQREGNVTKRKQINLLMWHMAWRVSRSASFWHNYQFMTLNTVLRTYTKRTKIHK